MHAQSIKCHVIHSKIYSCTPYPLPSITTVDSFARSRQCWVLTESKSFLGDSKYAWSLIDTNICFNGALFLLLLKRGGGALQTHIVSAVNLCPLIFPGLKQEMNMCTKFRYLANRFVCIPFSFENNQNFCCLISL